MILRSLGWVSGSSGVWEAGGGGRGKGFNVGDALIMAFRSCSTVISLGGLDEAPLVGCETPLVGCEASLIDCEASLIDRGVDGVDSAGDCC